MPTAPPAPALPKTATEDSAVGVQAFARHWIELANLASATGDTAEMDELSAASCKSCSTFIDRVGEAYEGGGHLMGGQITVVKSSAAEPASDAETLVTVKVKIAEQQAMDAAGEVVQNYGAGKNTFLFYLDRRDGSWLVTEIKIEDGS